MKKLTAVVVASLVGLTIVAVPAQASASDDRMFYRLVTKDAPALKGIKQKDLVKTAKETCKFLRSGFGILDAHDMMLESGFTDREANSFLAGAVVFYCPDQSENW